MRIEHVGYMAEDPVQAAEWYVRHLGFSIARQQDEPPFTRFLVDCDGRGVLEIYNNPEAQVPDYRAQHPLVLHLAFDVGSEPIEAAAGRLLAAGATVAEALKITEQGDRLIMLRDPWGFPIQIARRRTALA